MDITAEFAGEPRGALPSLSFSGMPKAYIKKLLDNCPDWPEEALETFREQPAHKQFNSQRISANSESNAWQNTGIVLYPGTVLQIYGGSESISYNNRYNYVNIHGKDIQTGRHENSEGQSGYPCTGMCNKWGFYASTTEYFREPNHGFGSGVASSYDPSWENAWLIIGGNQGFVETICNDNYMNDNSGEFSAIIEWRPAGTFLRWLLESPIRA